MRKWILALLGLVVVVLLVFLLSPRPAVAIVRSVFDAGAAEASAKLQPHVPTSVSTETVQYDTADSDAVMDIHRPPKLRENAPTIVWIHGGGFVSGRRSDISNYARILAGQGFTVVNIDYSIAPEAHYPTPIRQVSKALGYLTRNGAALGINPERLVLAGDSAGAQIAAQTAAVITNADYARQVGIAPGAKPEQLAGALLYCGVYDIAGMGQNGGLLGWFVQSAGWAYSGKRNWRTDKPFQSMTIAPHLTARFPPSFISAGNADPLGPQSVDLAQSLGRKGVPVETLFFRPDHQPALGHEYQFDLDSAAGRLALEKSVRWLSGL